MNKSMKETIVKSAPCFLVNTPAPTLTLFAGTAVRLSLCMALPTLGACLETFIRCW